MKYTLNGLQVVNMKQQYTCKICTNWLASNLKGTHSFRPTYICTCMVQESNVPLEELVGPVKGVYSRKTAITITVVHWKEWVEMYFVPYTVEPLNNGHIGTDHFVHYREVVLFQR